MASLPGTVLNLKAGFLATLRQGFKEILPVHIIEKNVLPPAPSVHHMADGYGILNFNFRGMASLA